MEATVETKQTKHLTVRCQFCDTWNRIDASRVAARPKCGTCAKPILLDRPLKLDDETFARTIADTEVPVFVDFYADWCGPCKLMAPSVDEIASEYVGRVLVAKLDTDRAQTTAQGFQVRGIPTSILFRDGKEVARQVGAVDLTGLRKLIESVL